MPSLVPAGRPPRPGSISLLASLFALVLPLLGLSAGLSAPASAQGGPPPVTAQERQATIAEISKLLEEHYVFPQIAKQAAARLATQEKAGAYAKSDDPFAFADALTHDLQELAKDRHLRVLVHPPGPAGKLPEPDPVEEEREAKAANYDFREVRLLPGNIGYMRLDGFAPPRFGGRTALAAMNFLGGADALVFDLRANSGGEPSMVQLLASFLFKEPTHLTDIYSREGERTDQFWTLPYLEAEARPDVPVYILTSSRTFSAAEDFTYSLKALKRATVVGEATGGGANPGEAFGVGERFSIWVSTGRSINPTTGTNWEGTGVEPDVKVAAKDALLTAQAAALDRLAALAKDPGAQGRYRFARSLVEGELHPYRPEAAQLADYTGGYTPLRVALGEGGLVVLGEGRPNTKLLPIGRDLFAPEGFEDLLMRFERDAAGKVSKVVLLFADGHQNETPRTP